MPTVRCHKNHRLMCYESLPQMGGWQEVAKLAAKHHLGGAEHRVSVRCVSIGHQGPRKLLIVKASTPISILSEQSLHALDAKFCPLVTLSICYCVASSSG